MNPNLLRGFVDGNGDLQQDKMQVLLDTIRSDIADANARGETMEERMMRERAEWTENDDRVKQKGNEAFRAGDLRQAYLCYTSVIDVSTSWHDAVYWLNRAAVCLKLKAYAHAEEDAEVAFERQPSAKALYRRGQARRFLGRLTEAEHDLLGALGFEPGNKALLDELAEIRSLRGRPQEELQQWLAENKGIDRPLPDVPEEELDDLAAAVYRACQQPG